MDDSQFVIIYYDKSDTKIYDTTDDGIEITLYPTQREIKEDYLPDRLKGFVVYATVEKRVYF